MLNGITYIVRPVPSISLVDPSDCWLLNWSPKSTFHAVREAIVDGFGKIVRRHPVSKLTLNSFFTGGHGITALGRYDERPALHSGNISWIRTGEPTVWEITHVNPLSLFTPSLTSLSNSWYKSISLFHLSIDWNRRVPLQRQFWDILSDIRGFIFWWFFRGRLVSRFYLVHRISKWVPKDQEYCFCCYFCCYNQVPLRQIETNGNNAKRISRLQHWNISNNHATAHRCRPWSSFLHLTDTNRLLLTA